MSDQQATQIDSELEQDWLSEAHPRPGVVSASEAAAVLGVNERTIRRAIQRGELAASKHGRSFQITREALDAFQARRDRASDPEPLLRLIDPAVPAPEVDLISGPIPVPFVATEAIEQPALPAPLNRFVGRTREIASLSALLLERDVRLLTLTGPGGVGKTRLALHVARDVAAEFLDGAVFVPLAAVPSPDLVSSALTKSLGLMDSDMLSPTERLKATWREREVLLILDNFEHLVRADSAACVVVLDLLMGCPGVKVLVTSRIPLRLTGEHAFVVPTMALPESGNHESGTHALSALDELGQVEAIQLFVDRAKTAWPDFTLTAQNAAAVAAICERVDGLPLAIELAAARSAVLSPPALLARLTQRLRVLTGGPRDQPARLRTMREAIAWSYDLLDAAAQARFRRLAVFRGGFALEGAEAVAYWPQMPSGERSLAAEESVLDSLAALLTSSLIQRRDLPDSEPRFDMLETVREFALERLDAAGEEQATRSAHAAFYLQLMERAEPALWAATNKELLEQIETEHDNLRGALAWAVEHEAETALRLASAIGPFWSKRSHWAEGRSWLERVLHTGVFPDSRERAIALGRAAVIVGDQGDFDDACQYYEESLALAERLGDAAVEARALRGLGIMASNQSDFPHATTFFTQSLSRFRALKDQPGIARCLNDLGLVAERQGDHNRAIAYQEEALPIVRAMSDDWQLGIVLGNLGGAYYDRGDFARGEALTQESLDICRQISDTFGVAVNLHNLGNFMVEIGNPMAAIERYRESLALTRDLGEHHLASRTLDRLGVALHQTGASRQAARLFGAASALRESIGDSLFMEEDANLTVRFQQVREELGEAIYLAAWDSGRSLPFDIAVKEALALSDQALAARPAEPTRAVAGLSIREVEVLRLLADGQPDKSIANALFISPRTASSHVAAIIAKLGVDSRTAAVAMALRAGIV
jgi:excisionase family DNA binding protein